MKKKAEKSVNDKTTNNTMNKYNIFTKYIITIGMLLFFCNVQHVRSAVVPTALPLGGLFNGYSIEDASLKFYKQTGM